MEATEAWNSHYHQLSMEWKEGGLSTGSGRRERVIKHGGFLSRRQRALCLDLLAERMGCYLYAVLRKMAPAVGTGRARKPML